jgi:hypothetical protein
MFLRSFFFPSFVVISCTNWICCLSVSVFFWDMYFTYHACLVMFQCDYVYLYFNSSTENGISAGS